MTLQRIPNYFKKVISIGLLITIAITNQSCVSNFASKFGRTKYTVSSNVPNTQVSRTKHFGSAKEIKVQGKKAVFNVSNTRHNTINISKPGYQTETYVVFADSKNRRNKLLDAAALIGLPTIGGIIISKAPSLTPVGASMVGYGIIHFYSVFQPYPGVTGQFVKYKNPNLKIELFPDSLANPSRFDVVCDEFKVNLKSGSVLGNAYRFGQKIDSYTVKDSSNTSSSDIIYDINKHLSNLHLLRSAATIEKTKSIFDRSIDPRYIIRGAIKTISIDAHSSSDYVFKTTLKVEWKVYDRLERLLFTKTFEGVGQRAKATDDGDSEGVSSSIDDAVRRSVNQLLFSKEFVNYIQKSKDFDKKNVFENYNDEFAIAKPKAISNPKVLAEASNSVVTIIRTESHGSGTVISQDGYILTNAHVCGSDTVLKIRFKNGDETTATLLRMNIDEDLALLKFDNKNKIPGLILMKDNSDVTVSDEIYVVGTPADLTLGQSISRGLISGERVIKKRKLYQTDAAINGGNSGGAMLDKKGNVIGIPSSKIKGTGLEGLGFAIPSAVAFEALKISY
jgi:S1-C subfamily serine protease